MAGGALSVTVTFRVHCLVRPTASVARNTTLLTPAGKYEPLAKPLTRIAVPLVGAQLSVNEGAAYNTNAVQPSEVLVWMFGGQLRLGAWVSFTVTRKVHVFVLPEASVAFHCTMVGPFENVPVLLGVPCAVPLPPLTCATAGPGVLQLSVAVGVV